MIKVGHSENSLISRINKSANGRYKSLQGVYNPRIGGPYRGPLKKPMFRSKLELRLMTMLDAVEAKNVYAWEYESKRIPYKDKSTISSSNGLPTNPVRHYVIDFVVTLKSPYDSSLTTFWIETKSINDIIVNKTKKRTKNAAISEKIRVKNYCKWIAAKQAAEAVHAKFVVITERELDSLKKLIYGH